MSYYTELPKPPLASAGDIRVFDLTPLLAGAATTALADQLRKACQDIGFFYVQGHGISNDLLEAIFEASRRFFAEPLEARMKI